MAAVRAAPINSRYASWTPTPEKAVRDDGTLDLRWRRQPWVIQNSRLSFLAPFFLYVQLHSQSPIGAPPLSSIIELQWA